eukprot:SAG31_NODE_2464_length_5655_cov_2.777898_5_plen_265_part_00
MPGFQITVLCEHIVQRDSHGGDAAYMLWPFKLLVGRVQQSGWCGKVHPNTTKKWDSFKSVEQCNDTATGKIGCLFDVRADPGEHNDLAMLPTHQAIAEDIYRRMQAAEQHWFNPDRGEPDSRACAQAKANGGFWGPFLAKLPPAPAPPRNGYVETSGIKYCSGGGDLTIGNAFGAGCMPESGRPPLCKNPLLPVSWSDAQGVLQCESICTNRSRCVGFTYYQGDEATQGLRRCCFRTGNVGVKPRCSGPSCTARCYEKVSTTSG